jgi:hypothetical protein
MLYSRKLTTGLGAVSLLALLVAPTLADNMPKASLTGFQEVPALSTSGTGSCKVKINSDETVIEAQVSYSDLEGPVTQAHVHFGQKSVSGGVSFFFCSNLPSPPTGTPPCPSPSGTVTRTIIAADIVGPAPQGIFRGELTEVIDAIRAGMAYCNVHSTRYPDGEIRGQLELQ